MSYGNGRLGLAALGGAGVGLYALLVRGSLTLNVGIGRSLRALGPLSCQVAAPREVVFDVVSAPYLHRTPRALESKLRVLERGDNLVGLLRLARRAFAVGPQEALQIAVERPRAMFA